MAPDTGSDTGEAEEAIMVVVHGEVDRADVDYARHRLATVVEGIAEPVLLVRLRLTKAPDPARERPALAQATIDVNGDVLRAHASGTHMAEAADLLRARVKHQLEDRHERQKAWHHRSGAGHDELPSPATAPVVPAEDGVIVPRPAHDLHELTVDEAAFDLEQLDSAFLLFRELGSGREAMLERLPGGGHHLVRQGSADTDLGPTAVAVVVAPQPAPVLALDDALERLRASGEGHLFFEDAGSGRGQVLYVRDDGDVGLVTAT